MKRFVLSLSGLLALCVGTSYAQCQNGNCQLIRQQPQTCSGGQCGGDTTSRCFIPPNTSVLPFVPPVRPRLIGAFATGDRPQPVRNIVRRFLNR